MRETRVFHLIKGLGRGGAEMLLSQGLGCATNTRFQYSYGYFLPRKDALVGELEQQGATVTCFNAQSSPAILAAAWRLSRFLRRNQIDLVHCHLPLAGIVGRLAGRLASVPVLYTEHNLIETYNPLTRQMNLSTWRLQRHVIAVSKDVASSVQRHTRSKVPVDVVQNGVDIKRFSRVPADGLRIRKHWDIPPDAPVMGTIAVFRPQKQLDLWLRAARLLLTRIPDVHFLLVGDGPLRSTLEQQAVSAGLGSALRFAGLQTDTPAFLSAMDVFLLSSTFEGLPVALLEAMACECVPVATAVGGVPEVITDNTCGVLLEHANEESIADVVELLLKDESQRLRIAAGARRRVEQQFSMVRMMHDLEGIYSTVLES